MPSGKVNNFFYNLNSDFNRLLPVIIPLGVALGILLPSVFIHLRPYVPWLFGLMTFSGALKLRAAEFGDTVRRPAPILIFFAVSHILMPLVAMSASSLFFTDMDLITGYILLFAGPTAVSGIIWSAILKGDKALCLTLILLDTLFAPLIVPGTVSVLMGAKTVMNTGGIAISLLFMVVIPTIIGVTVNEVSKEKISAVVCPYLDPAAKICLVLVIAANTSPVAPWIRFNDPLIWKAALVCILLTVTGFMLIKLVTVIGKIKAPKDITLIISCALKNNSAVMTIAVTFFPEAAALPIMLSIVFQQMIAAIMGRMFTKEKSTTHTN